MSLYRNKPVQHADSLPSGDDEQLARVDSLLWREAASHTLPEGLERRVYEVSVSHLPRQRALMFPRSSSRPVRHLPIISRLSMAAAVLLAVAVGVVFLRSPGASGPSGLLDQLAYNDGYNGARSGMAAAPASMVASRHATALSVEQEWLLLDSVQLSHYAAMRHLSLADVSDDIAMLVRELEM